MRLHWVRDYDSQIIELDSIWVGRIISCAVYGASAVSGVLCIHLSAKRIFHDDLISTSIFFISSLYSKWKVFFFFLLLPHNLVPSHLCLFPFKHHRSTIIFALRLLFHHSSWIVSNDVKWFQRKKKRKICSHFLSQKIGIL